MTGVQTCALPISLTFSEKRIAREVKKILQSAIANAENNHDLDVDDLVVTEASVGRNLTMKRFHARARGRGARIEKPFSQVTIIVEERQQEAPEDKSRAASKAPAKGKGRAGAAGAARNKQKTKETA